MQIKLQVIPSQTEVIAGDGALEEGEFGFCNYYRCPYDDTTWADEWSCACNDRCPTCRAEIEPYYSEETDNRRIVAYLDAFRDESPVQS